MFSNNYFFYIIYVFIQKMNLIDLFSGKTGLVERSSLIKHSTNKANQEDIQRMQNAERSSTNSDNQAFLTDVRFF